MKNEILAWYAYSESGAAATNPRSRVAALPPDDVIDLDSPASVADLFADVRRLDSEVNADGWKHLFSSYGLEALIDFARKDHWPQATSDHTVADAIVSEALDAGYDPVSGLIGRVTPVTHEFEPVATAVVRKRKRRKARCLSQN